MPDGSPANPDKGWDYDKTNRMAGINQAIEQRKIAVGSNRFKKTLFEQMEKKLAQNAKVVESSIDRTITPNSMEHQTAQDLLNKLIGNAEKATGDNRLLEMWSNPEKYHDHVRRRLKAGHITSESDYKEKTFATLANAQKLIVAIPNQGDKISRKMELHTKDWIVLLGTNGEIVTSYPLNPLKPSFEDNETSIGNKIYEHTIDKRTREILKRVFNLSQ